MDFQWHFPTTCHFSVDFLKDVGEDQAGRASNCLYEEFTGLAGTRVAQNTSNYLTIA